MVVDSDADGDVGGGVVVELEVDEASDSVESGIGAVVVDVVSAVTFLDVVVVDDVVVVVVGAALVDDALPVVDVVLTVVDVAGVRPVVEADKGAGDGEPAVVTLSTGVAPPLAVADSELSSPEERSSPDACAAVLSVPTSTLEWMAGDWAVAVRTSVATDRSAPQAATI